MNKPEKEKEEEEEEEEPNKPVSTQYFLNQTFLYLQSFNTFSLTL